MSEPQAEYETDTDDPQPTLGEDWSITTPHIDDFASPQNSAAVYSEIEGDYVAEVYSSPDGVSAADRARLIAAAGTAASELPDEYDAAAAVEALPVIVKILEETLWSFEKYNLNNIADRIRGVLNKARGDTDE